MAFNPLLAIGMQIARENSVTDITDFYDELEKVMLEFIDGKISKENAIDFFIDKTGSTKAIDRIAEILSVEDSPLPPSNEKFIQSPLFFVHPRAHDHPIRTGKHFRR